MIEARHGDGVTERFAYDRALNVAASADGASPLAPRRIGPGGRVLEARGPEGERVTLAHDERRRVVERKVERKGFRPRIWRYGWDARDHMVRCVTPEEEAWSYNYDPFGRRVSKMRLLSDQEQAWVRVRYPDLTPAAFKRGGLDVWPKRPPGADEEFGRVPVLGVKYLWDGNVVAEEAPLRLDGTVDWDNATRWHFEPGSFVPLAKEAGGHLLYVVTDHLGTPREMTDEADHLVWAGEQRLWGGLRRVTIADEDGVFASRLSSRSGKDGVSAAPLPDNEPEAPFACPIRFQGQWHDVETDCLYNYHRHYEPITHQYLTSDPIGLEGGYRSFGYVDNPTAQIDPFGLAKCKAIGVGPYSLTGGHHIHAQAAFSGNPSYNPGLALTINQKYMKCKGWNHHAITNKQRAMSGELPPAASRTRWQSKTKLQPKP